jgi:hypothetical protein
MRRIVGLIAIASAVGAFPFAAAPVAATARGGPVISQAYYLFYRYDYAAPTASTGGTCTSRIAAR